MLDLISSALLSDMEIFFFFFSGHNDHSNNSRMKYTGVMLQEEKKPMGKMACCFWMFFIREKNTFQKSTWFSCHALLRSTAGVDILY